MYGYSIEEIRDWRKREYEAGRHWSLTAFYAARGIDFKLAALHCRIMELAKKAGGTHSADLAQIADLVIRHKTAEAVAIAQTLARTHRARVLALIKPALPTCPECGEPSYSGKPYATVCAKCAQSI